MKAVLLTLILIVGTTAVCEAKPLLVTWPRYRQGPTPAERLVLYRNVNGGQWSPYATVWELTSTAYVDNFVKWNRTYCYRLAAVSETGASSPFTAPACARPNK